MNDHELIMHYFKRSGLDEEQQLQVDQIVDQKIKHDRQFAELCVIHAKLLQLRNKPQFKNEELRQRFKELDEHQQLEKKTKIRNIRRWLIPGSIAASFSKMLKKEPPSATGTEIKLTAADSAGKEQFGEKHKVIKLKVWEPIIV